MTDCCNASFSQHYSASHLVIIGGGSAAFAASIRAVELGASATIINDRLPIGGTCVNVGCVPSKTLIRAAEAHHRAGHHAFDGIESSSRVTSFQAIIRQKRELVEHLRQAKYLDVVDPLPGVRLVEGRARLVAPGTVEVNGERIIGDRVLIATGASPFVPRIPGLANAGYLTNESLFELEELPESLIVLGGRYVALECAQMMARFGTRVTILQRSERILPTETPDLTDALTEYLRAEGVNIVTGVEASSVRREGDRIIIDARVRGEPGRFEASHILAATGRHANTADMGLDRIGVTLDDLPPVYVPVAMRVGPHFRSSPGLFPWCSPVGD